VLLHEATVEPFQAVAESVDPTADPATAEPLYASADPATAGAAPIDTS
jgi:hypothetical protein